MEHLAETTAAVVPADESTVANELEPAASVEANDAIAPLEPTPAAVDVMTETEEETSEETPSSMAASRPPPSSGSATDMRHRRPSDADSAFRWDAISNKELKVRTKSTLDSCLVDKVPAGTAVSIIAQRNEGGTRRAKIAYSKNGETRRGWVSWRGKSSSEKILSPIASPANSFKANSPSAARSRRPSDVVYGGGLSASSAPRQPTHGSPSPGSAAGAGSGAVSGSGGSGAGAGAGAGAGTKAKVFASRLVRLSKEGSFATLKGSTPFYRTEDTLPVAIQVTGEAKLPVTASYKNRSDRRLFRIERAISTAKARIVQAEAGARRRMSHEGGVVDHVLAVPKREQQQHVLRHHVWRRKRLSLSQTENEWLRQDYQRAAKALDPLEA